MKFCIICDKQFHDDYYNCPYDGQPLRTKEVYERIKSKWIKKH